MVRGEWDVQTSLGGLCGSGLQKTEARNIEDWQPLLERAITHLVSQGAKNKKNGQCGVSDPKISESTCTKYIVF